MHWQGAGPAATSGDAVAPRRIHPGGDRRQARRGAHRGLPRICSPSATHGAAGIPPILRRHALPRWQKMKFKGARIAVRPDTPADGRNVQPRGGGSILERKEDLRPTCRWILYPTKVVVCSAQPCTLFDMPHKPTRFRHMPTQARTCRHIPARPWNCLLRSASHCEVDTYIAGYAPRSLSGQTPGRLGRVSPRD